jgi:hypothetical protein
MARFRPGRDKFPRRYKSQEQEGRLFAADGAHVGQEVFMSVVNPLPREKAASELHPIYDGVSKKFGKMPNIFGLMAHRPDVLAKFLPFFSAVIEGGTVEARYKELAYLKTSLLNGCEY